MTDEQNLNITNDESEVLQHLDDIVSGADSEKSALGFIRNTEYPKAAAKGRIFVATEDSEFRGFILIGGTFPTIKVVQTFVPEEFRGSGVAKRLVEHICQYGNEHKHASVRARVAAELEANKFWRSAGFILVGQDEKSEKSRVINIYEYALDAPILFPVGGFSQGVTSIERDKRPIVSSPSYAIDINVLLDLLRGRSHEEDVRNLISHVMASETRLYVTSEFQKELSKHTTGSEDNLLKILGALPVLPEVPVPEELLQQLTSAVIPNGKKVTDQDKSDLQHLAQSILNELSGFVTNEKMLLSAHHNLKRQFGLDVVTPGEITAGEVEPHVHFLTLAERSEFEVRLMRVGDRIELHRFLAANLYADETTRGLANDMNMMIASSSHLVIQDDHVIGALILKDIVGRTQKKTCVVCIEETSPNGKSIANCLFGLLLSNLAEGLSIIELLVSPLADKVRNTAYQLGFLKIENQEGRLIKFNYNHVIDKPTWHMLVDDLESEGIRINRRMPSNAEMKNTGILVNFSENARGSYNLFELETLFSPLLILTGVREAFIVPIRERYANLINVEVQMPLLPEPQGVIRAERAYFASPTAVRRLSKGALVVFYVSGNRKGRMEAVGICRVTACAVLPRDVALTNFRSQGVYSVDDIEGIGEQVGVFSFDRFTAFNNPIPYEKLLSMKCVGGANLVSTQNLSHRQLLDIIKEGFVE